MESEKCSVFNEHAKDCKTGGATQWGRQTEKSGGGVDWIDVRKKCS